MARTATEYLRMLQALLPGGKAWNRNEGSTLSSVLLALADELVRIDERSDTLLDESITTLTSELLADHEDDFGIPDDCVGVKDTTIERRQTIHAKLLTIGQQDKDYFIEMAAALGHTANIVEYTPFWAGLGVAGAPCGDYDVIFHWDLLSQLYSSGEEDTEGAFGTGFAGGFDIDLYATGVEYPGGSFSLAFECSFDEGDWLVYIPSFDTLQCLIERFKPGHTTATVDFYPNPAYGRGFDPAFEATISSKTQSWLEGAFGKGFHFGFYTRNGGAFDVDAFWWGFDQARFLNAGAFDELAFGDGFDQKALSS